MDTPEYCREIETYLCRKNGGHLIRVVGPSFDLVSGWAQQGIPLNVALAGIDRYFERQACAKTARRRPVRIDFCDADVLDVFDQWRRAVLAPATNEAAPGEVVPAGRSGQSLPNHLERVLLRLSSGRASGALGPAFDPLIDRINTELDAARAGGGLRGDARRAALSRLEAIDGELVALATSQLDPAVRDRLDAAAAEELGDYRDRMSAEALARARRAVVERLVREQLALPTVAYPAAP